MYLRFEHPWPLAVKEFHRHERIHAFVGTLAEFIVNGLQRAKLCSISAAVSRGLSGVSKGRDPSNCERGRREMSGSMIGSTEGVIRLHGEGSLEGSGVVDAMVS